MQSKFPSCWKGWVQRRTKLERGDAGAKIVEGWERSVETTASKVIGKKKSRYYGGWHQIYGGYALFTMVLRNSVQQSSKRVGRGSKRGCKSEEKSTRKIYIEQNYGRIGGV